MRPAGLRSVRAGEGPHLSADLITTRFHLIDKVKAECNCLPKGNLMSNVVYLHGQPAPIVRLLRVAEHRRLEQLLAADKLPYDRFVVEAGSFKTQTEFLKAAKEKGHELVLDTNVAELCAVAKYSGHAKHAPWANPEGVLTEGQLKAGSNAAVISEIARFAVSNGFSRVLAPSRFVSGPLDPWFEIDLSNSAALRRALDSEGGKSIAIDLPLIVPTHALNDIAQRRQLVAKCRDLPIDSVWMRISGFGAHATAAGLRKYISAVQEFHGLNKPIVADGVGGFAALAIAAFGAACGISYGVAARERFDASNWYKPPKPDAGGGGSAYSVLLPGIDTLLKRDEAEAIINASGGRRLASCNDRSCCPHGFQDTIRDPKGHFLRQRAFRCDSLSLIPEPMRAQHFLDKDLKEADRRARLIAKLRISNEKLSGRLAENAGRLERMRDVLENLERTSAPASRSTSFANVSSKTLFREDKR
jgi:hypothetical protein